MTIDAIGFNLLISGLFGLLLWCSCIGLIAVSVIRGLLLVCVRLLLVIYCIGIRCALRLLLLLLFLLVEYWFAWGC